MTRSTGGACRSRGARRTLRIGGRLILGLAVALTVMKRNPSLGRWAQFADLSGDYLRLLMIYAAMPLLCLRASVAIADERRRGTLAPLFLAGIGPAALVWSKVKGALRPAVPLTAMVAIFWLADVGTLIGSFTNPRLWLDGLVVIAAVGAGYFLAVSLGLLASACRPRPALPSSRVWGCYSPGMPPLRWSRKSSSALARDPERYALLTLVHDRRPTGRSNQPPEEPCRAIPAPLPGELGHHLGCGHDARRPRRVDRRPLPDVARARSAGGLTRPDSS